MRAAGQTLKEKGKKTFFHFFKFYNFLYFNITKAQV